MNKFINIEPNGVKGLGRFLDSGNISYEKGNASKLNYTRFEFDGIDDIDFEIIVDYIKNIISNIIWNKKRCIKWIRHYMGIIEYNHFEIENFINILNKIK